MVEWQARLVPPPEPTLVSPSHELVRQGMVTKLCKPARWKPYVVGLFSEGPLLVYAQGSLGPGEGALKVHGILTVVGVSTGAEDGSGEPGDALPPSWAKHHPIKVLARPKSIVLGCKDEGERQEWLVALRQALTFKPTLAVGGASSSLAQAQGQGQAQVQGQAQGGQAQAPSARPSLSSIGGSHEGGQVGGRSTTGRVRAGGTPVSTTGSTSLPSARPPLPSAASTAYSAYSSVPDDGTGTWEGAEGSWEGPDTAQGGSNVGAHSQLLTGAGPQAQMQMQGTLTSTSTAGGGQDMGGPKGSFFTQPKAQQQVIPAAVASPGKVQQQRATQGQGTGMSPAAPPGAQGLAQAPRTARTLSQQSTPTAMIAPIPMPIAPVQTAPVVSGTVSPQYHLRKVTEGPAAAELRHVSRGSDVSVGYGHGQGAGTANVTTTGTATGIGIGGGTGTGEGGVSRVAPAPVQRQQAGTASMGGMHRQQGSVSAATSSNSAVHRLTPTVTIPLPLNGSQTPPDRAPHPLPMGTGTTMGRGGGGWQGPVQQLMTQSYRPVQEPAPNTPTVARPAPPLQASARGPTTVPAPLPSMPTPYQAPFQSMTQRTVYSQGNSLPGPAQQGGSIWPYPPAPAAPITQTSGAQAGWSRGEPEDAAAALRAMIQAEGQREAPVTGTTPVQYPPLPGQQVMPGQQLMYGAGGRQGDRTAQMLMLRQRPASYDPFAALDPFR